MSMVVVANYESAAPRVGVAGSEPASLTAQDFELFVRNYAERLHAVARRVLHCEEDAADAVQDALLSAFRARHRFQSDSTVYTWLYRIVVNACLMKVRSNSRARSVSLESLPATRDEVGQTGLGGSHSPARAEDRLEREETRATVHACIERLPDDYRTILWLRDIEQLDTDATAAQLKLSRSAVKTRLHRARRALGRLLAPHFAEAQEGRS